ncbi:MAG: TAXI family TRAP transporter solute-binding subunit [Vicinamibacterales bacterium]
MRIARAFPPLSDRLAEEYRRTLPGLDIRLEDVGDALEAIQNNTADLGITTADHAYADYWNIERVPESEKLVRGLSLLQPLSAYVLVRPGSRIRRVEDLAGRVVVVGPKNTTSWTLGNLVLEAVGARPRLIRSVNTRAEGAKALKDGSADAIILPGYTYPDEATQATIREGAYLIPIEGPGVDGLRRRFPFIRATAIPRNIYPGQDRVIPTVGLDMVVVCRRDLDESVVHDLTQQLFDSFPRLSGVEASLRFLDLDRAPATPLPIHPGAARYFRERELSR